MVIITAKNEIATPPFRMLKLVVVKLRGFAMTKCLSSRAQRGDLSFSFKLKSKSEIATPPFRMLKLVVVKPRGFAMTKQVVLLVGRVEM